MKRNIVLIFLGIIFFILQSTVFKALAFGDISPNLLTILVASVGFMSGKKKGLFIGFFCGLLQDVMFGDLLGFYALLYMYVGFVNGFFNKNFFPDDIRMPLFMITVSDFVYSLACYIFLFLLNAKLDFIFYLNHIILPQLIYTILAAIFLYPVILFIHKKLEASEKLHEKKFV